MWTRKDLKDKAKAALKANYWSCVVAALILTIIVGGTASISTVISKRSNNSTYTPQQTNTTQQISGDTLNINGVEIDLKDIDGAGIEKALDAFSDGLEKGVVNINGESIDVTNPEEVAEVQKAIADLKDSDLSKYSHADVVNGATGILTLLGGVALTILFFGALIRIFLLNPLVVGCEGFFMVNSREKAELGEIKRGFAPGWMRNVGSMLLRDVFLCLWSMLCIIPGIIKSYSYCMVPFILADDPSIGAAEAITLSRKMMNGHKWNTFVLDLSFIGWGILTALTFGILGVFYVNPYIYGTHAELYNTLKNN